MFLNKKVLITGGTGMIGRALTKQLLQKGASLRIATLDKLSPNQKDNRVEYSITDLKYLSNCEAVCNGIDMVFQLVGTTGSPATAKERPGTFFLQNLLPNINMLEAAWHSGVSHYLYTSTYGVYGTSPVMREDKMWNTYPSDADKYAGWAKRMGELQIEAYSKEHNWDSLYIVRPANVYGPYANFNPLNSMVVASLIRRVVNGEDPLVVWGDGSAIRDFIHCDDVALGMIKTVEEDIKGPINLGSGKGTSIKELIGVILDNVPNKPAIEWDQSKPQGDDIRILDTSKAHSYGIRPRKSLSDGIKETINWYKENHLQLNSKYNAFEI